jgi:prophage antirepressor-like protein
MREQSVNILKGDNTMNELTVFQNAQFGSVRVTEREGEPWFVAADVCRALEISNPSVALDRLDDDERSKFNLGRQGETNVVNEPGLYELIMGSRKPEAKAFKRWVKHEVLPSIRKHGAYATAAVIDNILADPDYGIRLLKELKAEREKNAMLQPKADYFDALVERNTLTGIRETAKELGVKQKMFTGFLIENGYLYRDNMSKLQPYAKHVGDGLFVLKECKSDKNGWSGTQLLITPKGRETFRLLIKTPAA